MTLDLTSNTRHFSLKRQNLSADLDAFANKYLSLDSNGKKEALPQFISLCKKAEKNPRLYQKIGEIFLLLTPRDQKACAKEQYAELSKHVMKRLTFKAPNCVYPLLLLSEKCLLQPVSSTTKKMSPLYREIITTLLTTAQQKNETANAFNQLIERRLPPTKPIHLHHPFITLPFERTALVIRQAICSVHANSLFFSGTTTHQRVQADGESIETDPYADDGAALELQQKDQCHRLVSITDGGGKGDAVVETAKLINRLFLSCLVAHTSPLETPEQAAELLLQATYFTQSRLRQEEQIQHATHAGLLAIIPKNHPPFGAVSLLGDTIAYLLTDDGDEVHLERMNSIDSEKQASHTGGDFSSTGDYSSLTVATFELPPVKRACIILGTDGLADNLDPRNALNPTLFDQLDSDPESFYRKRLLSLENRTVSFSNALMNVHDQKDPHILDATHLFHTPWALCEALKTLALSPAEKAQLNELPIDETQSWKGEKATPSHQQDLLIELYTKIKFRSLYNPASPENFAASLATEARHNGKSDDILAAICWLKI